MLWNCIGAHISTWETSTSIEPYSTFFANHGIASLLASYNERKRVHPLFISESKVSGGLDKMLAFSEKLTIY